MASKNKSFPNGACKAAPPMGRDEMNQQFSQIMSMILQNPSRLAESTNVTRK
jgi:hypothetical protein